MILRKEQQQDFSIRKEILWETELGTDNEVNQKEIEFIKLYDSNNPSVGYNRFPKFKTAFVVSVTEWEM